MGMKVIETTFEKVRKFAVEDNKLIACYKKNDAGDWYLDSDNIDFDDEIKDDMIVNAKEIRGCVDLKDTANLDKSMLFVLHTNNNLPKIIPCIKR